MTPVFNDVAAITTQIILDQLVNQLVKVNTLFKTVFGDNRKFVSGGTQIQQPIKLLENAAMGFVSGNETTVYDNNVSQQLNYIIFQFKYHYYNIVTTLEELTQAQNTPQAMADIVTVKAEGAISDAIQQLSASLFGSGADSGGQAFNGFGDVFAASGVAYGGITNTDAGAAEWLADIDTATAAVNYTAISSMLSRLSAKTGMYGFNMKTGKRNFSPNLILSNEAVRASYMNSQQGQQNYYNTNDLDSGFMKVMVNNVPWEVDQNSPGTAGVADNHCYILATDSLFFHYKYGLDKGCPMDQSQQSFSQPVKNQITHTVGNLICSKRNSNGVFKGINV